jgi:Beta-galactosidase
MQLRRRFCARPLLWLVLSLFCPAQLIAEQSILAPFGDAVKPQTVMYGVSYYSEYMPYERLDQDVTLMKAAGINVVRMGESNWSLWEPEDGRFDYAWMDRVVDAMGKAQIKVILGTPTYSIPPWLYKEHPEVLARPLRWWSRLLRHAAEHRYGQRSIPLLRAACRDKSGQALPR